MKRFLKPRTLLLSRGRGKPAFALTQTGCFQSTAWAEHTTNEKLGSMSRKVVNTVPFLPGSRAYRPEVLPAPTLSVKQLGNSAEPHLTPVNKQDYPKPKPQLFRYRDGIPIPVDQVSCQTSCQCRCMGKFESHKAPLKKLATCQSSSASA